MTGHISWSVLVLNLFRSVDLDAAIAFGKGDQKLKTRTNVSVIVRLVAYVIDYLGRRAESAG